MAERRSRGVVVARAADLADEIGLHDVTITRLGRALGIAPPGVYRHVTDVADLRAAIGQQAAGELGTTLAAACAGLSGHDALSALANATRDWARAHPGRHEALQVAPDPDDVDGQAAARDLLAVFAAALRAYALADDGATDAIRMLRSTLHGFVMLELHGGFKQERSVDATFARIIDGLDGTLRGWAS